MKVVHHTSDNDEGGFLSIDESDGKSPTQSLFKIEEGLNKTQIVLLVPLIVPKKSITPRTCFES